MIYFEKIAPELRGAKRWILWRYERDQKGKPTKVPGSIKDGLFFRCSVTNVENYLLFEEVENQYENTHEQIDTRGHEKYRMCDGIGFVLGGGYAGADIDHKEEEIDKFLNGEDGLLREYSTALNDSYMEISPSGTGVHAIVKYSSDNAENENGCKNGDFEFYTQGRFFTVTGNRLSDAHTHVIEATAGFQSLRDKYGKKEKTATEDEKPFFVYSADSSGKLTEKEILEIACNHAANSKKFSDLWHGNWQGYYETQSEADFGLLQMLAFYTRKDSAMMDSLFRQSGLYREDKWNKRRSGTTHGALEIENAINLCSRVYSRTEMQIIPTQVDCLAVEELIHEYSNDDTGNALRIVDKTNGTLVYDDDLEEWFMYDGKTWNNVSDTRVRKLVDVIAKDIEEIAERTRYKDDCDNLKYIRSSKGQKACVDVLKHHVLFDGKWDSNPWLFNVQNGTIDLTNGEIYPHKLDDYITTISPATYNKAAACPRFDKFINSAFINNNELIRYVFALCGYFLTGSTREEVFVLMTGSGGNGKSLLATCLDAVMGEMTTATQSDLFEKKDLSGNEAMREIARWQPYRLITGAELKEGMTLDSNLVKVMTGGDRVQARHLYKTGFSYIPQWKMVVSCNTKPRITDTDNGIWRRIKILPFYYTPKPEEVDRTLKTEMPYVEKDGILSRFVAGAVDWYANGLTALEPVVVKQETAQYRSEQDVIAMFIEECFEENPFSRIPSSDAYKIYKEWIDESGFKPMSNVKFAGALKSHGIEIKKSSKFNYIDGFMFTERFGYMNKN